MGLGREGRRQASPGTRLPRVGEPESFLVDGPTGPLFDRLLDGELERARAWGESLAAGLDVAVGAR